MEKWGLPGLPPIRARSWPSKRTQPEANWLAVPDFSLAKMPPLVIGTRGSKLAMWQAHWIEQQLRALDTPTQIEIIKTTGDKITDVALAKVGSKTGLKGVFTKEIEEALLDGRVDIAVHSLKDLPTEIDSRLAIAAIPERADPRDALVGKKLDELEEGARVGTSSLRRAAQLRRLRPDVQVEDIRGNVDTRLRKLDEGQYDAVLLAAAGLERLGWQDRVAEILEPGVMCPAIGQGALAVQIRADDTATRKLVSSLNDPATKTAVSAERALLAALGGGCQVPLGGHARLDDGRLTLSAIVVSPDGSQSVATDIQGDPREPEALGHKAADDLRRQGASEIIAAVEAQE